jgi:hypothetical protein
MLRPTARIENTAALERSPARCTPRSSAGRAECRIRHDPGDRCAVYVCEPRRAPDDFNDGSLVIAAARVLYSVSLGQYRYAVGALPAGTTAAPTPYSVALTCDVDDPMVDDTSAVVTFTAGTNADVVIGQTTTVDFAP